MPPNSEIEKLERRWRENPKGTVFAPYAEVLRKNGDHELAKDILRQGLELHPNHIPGNIVLGRCSLDLGEDGPAEQAFAHVQSLDPENVIALQALSDITERQGRLAEAREWLGKLLSVDPSNDEARDQLARVEAAQLAASTAMTAAPPAEPEVAETTAEVPPAPLPSTVKTREIEVFARPKEGPLAEPNRAETSGGEISEAEPAPKYPVYESTRVMPAFDPVDAVFDAQVPEPPIGHVLDQSTAKTVELTPLMPQEPAPISDLEPVELDIASAAKSLEAAPLAGLEQDTEFVPPPPSAPIELSSTGGHEFQAPDASNELLDISPAGRSEFQAPDASNELLDISPAERSEFQAPDASNELLDITPAERSEFQAPDASHELLDLAPSGHSEFQEPDASQELMALSGTASSEYQTPSGTEALLSAPREAEPEPVEEKPAEPESQPEPEPVAATEASADDQDGPSLLADLAALSVAPTEEIATTMLPAITEPAASATEAPEAVDLTEPAASVESVAPPAAPEWLFEDAPAEEAAAEASAPAAEPTADEPAAEEPVHLPGDLEDDLSPAVAEADAELEPELEPEAQPAEAVAEAPSNDLKLIFPDDAAKPEPHQVRRITQEVELPAMAGDLDAHEPEPVLTETMAELYARQGHTAEALKVYRALAEKSPNDPRLRERMAQLELRVPAPPRRMTYVALETGGESVESFFRALAESRPGGATVHATGQIPDDDGSGAPTRPARDPLSLSAIFGEDPGNQSRQASAPVAPTAGPAPDAFSFDQFFGGSGNGGTQGTPRQESPAGEDLDQFQHWLKSLKK